jgi:hypothetical protein
VIEEGNGSIESGVENENISGESESGGSEASLRHPERKWRRRYREGESRK